MKSRPDEVVRRSRLQVAGSAVAVPATSAQAGAAGLSACAAAGNAAAAAAPLLALPLLPALRLCLRRSSSFQRKNPSGIRKHNTLITNDTVLYGTNSVNAKLSTGGT